MHLQHRKLAQKPRDEQSEPSLELCEGNNNFVVGGQLHRRGPSAPLVSLRNPPTVTSRTVVSGRLGSSESNHGTELEQEGEVRGGEGAEQGRRRRRWSVGLKHQAARSRARKTTSVRIGRMRPQARMSNNASYILSIFRKVNRNCALSLHENLTSPVYSRPHGLSEGE